MATPLEKLFESAKQQNRAVLIGFLPAGFPSQKKSKKIVKAMLDGGVEAIEIGFPYSDPVMDGPVIQAASDQAIKNGSGVKEVFDLLETSVNFGAPSMIMSYWSPIEKYGVKEFAAEISRVGGSGVITPDLTYEESDSWRVEASKNSINRIYVVAPSTTNDRLAKVSGECSGFIYAASLMGVTGARDSVSANAKQLVERIRAVSQTPVAVGLGVSNKDQATEVASYADGVIVGSAFIKVIWEFGSGRKGLKKVKELARSLAGGVSSARKI
jgi:tryptophan synthase alpha chain